MELHTQPISRRVNVGPVERGISLVTGMGLLSYVMTRKPPMSVPLALEAGYMIYRGATGHCVIYQTLEINRAQENGHQGIQVERSVTVNRPKDQLFRIWRNFENLPRFMKHLKSVRVDPESGGKRSHWVALAPLGRTIEWDSEVMEERENEMLAWKSVPGSLVESMGRVEFKRHPDSAVPSFMFRCSTTRRLVRWGQPLPGFLERSQDNRYAKTCVTSSRSWKRVKWPL